ncbi:unnamed protein product, partial [Effrenium voratum]
MKLGFCVLRVTPDKLTPLLDFYTRLGFASGEGGGLVLPWASASCGLRFLPDAKVRYQSSRTDLYWKIGLAVHDVQEASRQLPGCQPGEQFLDIGFLTHYRDPAGFCFELLQTTFESSEAQRKELQSRPRTGAGPMGDFVMGQITTRITEPERSLRFYRELGMKLLSIQPVTKYGFTLYFFAFTEENPPKEDLEAVENREWLYQRPYTTLELQHYHGSEGSKLRLPPPEEEGLAAVVLQVPPDALRRLSAWPGYMELLPGVGQLMDPDGPSE